MLDVCLGSWFVQERWICESTYCGCGGGQSDLHIAQGTNGQSVMESHWDTWITEEDWISIQVQGFNTVRIPVSSVEPNAALLLSLPPMMSDRVLSPIGHRTKGIR
jgi:hypothetical protein